MKHSLYKQFISVILSVSLGGIGLPAYSEGKSFIASPGFNSLLYVQNLNDPQFNGKIFVNDRHVYMINIYDKLMIKKRRARH